MFVAEVIDNITPNWCYFGWYDSLHSNTRSLVDLLGYYNSHSCNNFSAEYNDLRVHFRG